MAWDAEGAGRKYHEAYAAGPDGDERSALAHNGKYGKYREGGIFVLGATPTLGERVIAYPSRKSAHALAGKVTQFSKDTYGIGHSWVEFDNGKQEWVPDQLVHGLVSLWKYDNAHWY